MRSVTCTNYINTNETPGELSRENLICSHVIRSPLLRLHNFVAKCEMVWCFIGVYIINRTLHGRLEIQNFSHVEKHSISYLRAAI